MMGDTSRRTTFSTQGLWSSARVTIGFLFTTLTKALLPWSLSFARQPVLGTVLVVPNIFHYKNYGGHCCLGNLQCSRMFCRLPQVCASTLTLSLAQSLVSELCRQLLWPHGLVFALICIVCCETIYRQVCAFQNISNKCNSPQVNQGIEKWEA